MLPLLSSDAMRSADEQTIGPFGIPGFTLMENAGRALAYAAIAELQTVRAPLHTIVACVCGTGNNGGDGFVAARVLCEAGYDVRVTIVGPEDRIGSDSRQHLQLLRKMSVVSAYQADLSIVSTNEGPSAANRLEPACSLIIDALLGTGVRGAARQPVASWIDEINASNAIVVAADLPSGLNADTGRADGCVVRADRTITFGALKTGLALNNGPTHAGRVTIAPIGIPGFVLNELASRAGSAFVLTRGDIAIPTRGPNAHKYSSGMLAALCGSVGLTGAAVLATSAAMRVGAGAVKCAAGNQATEVLARKLTEVMTVSLRETVDGLAPESSSAAFMEMAQKATALLIGCGAGRGSGTASTIRQILEMATLPTVLDADGLFALGSAVDEVVSSSSCELILTPHRGEFERLVGRPVDWDNRIELAREYASKWNCVLLLKGLPSVAATPGGMAIVSNSSSTSLATAGSGDVLAGMIAGFLCQGVRPLDAVGAALFVGGQCAAQYEERNAPESMMATDIISEIPRTLRALTHV